MSDVVKHILVVDDNIALASVVRFNLQRAGYEVTLAGNGEEAWQLAQGDQPFDLIITDQQMPVMSGCELCELLRASEQYRDVPIIMLTAKGLELDLSRLKDQYGVTASFSKPFSPKEILQFVAEQLVTAT